MKQLNDLHELQEYFLGLFDRAEHHAPNVKLVIPNLAIFLIQRANLKIGIKIKSYNGNFKNTAWVFNKKGDRYFFAYDHINDQIVLRKSGIQGDDILVIDNSDNMKCIEQKLDARFP